MSRSRLSINPKTAQRPMHFKVSYLWQSDVRFNIRKISRLPGQVASISDGTSPTPCYETWNYVNWKFLWLAEIYFLMFVCELRLLCNSSTQAEIPEVQVVFNKRYHISNIIMTKNKSSALFCSTIATYSHDEHADEIRQPKSIYEMIDFK